MGPGAEENIPRIGEYPISQDSHAAYGEAQSGPHQADPAALPQLANPLFHLGPIVPYDQLRDEHFIEATEHHIAEAKRVCGAVVSLDGERTFENTLVCIDDAIRNVVVLLALAKLRLGFQRSESLEEIAEKVEARVDDLLLEVFHSQPLWQAFQSYAASSAFEQRTSAEKRAVDSYMNQFKRRGVVTRAGEPLGDADRGELREAIRELSAQCLEFNSRYNAALNDEALIVTDEARLNGIPADAVAAARQDAEKHNVEGWRFTANYDPYIAVLRFAHDPKLRQAMFDLNFTLCTSGDNDTTDTVTSILEARRKEATIIGYDNYASLVLELGGRALDSVEKVKAFLLETRDSIRPAFLRDEAELTARRAQDFPGTEGPIPLPDVEYYIEILRRERYSIDPEAVRPYFEAHQTLERLHEFFREEYGVTYHRVEGIPVWHPDVLVYRVTDSDGEELGICYYDLFARDGKDELTQQNCLWTGGIGPDGRVPNVGLVISNHQKPPLGAPLLWTHEIVFQTHFHENGHLLHTMCNKTLVRELSSEMLAWDFMEVPSQLQEEFGTEYESLRRIARHYLTGEELPRAECEKLNAAKNFMFAHKLMKDLTYSWLDLMLHTEFDPAIHGDIRDYSRRVMEEFWGRPLPENYCFVNSFAHLFEAPEGYASAYYGYPLSRTASKALFSYIRAHGVVNPEGTMAVRRELLEMGNSAPPMELFANVTGKAFSPASAFEDLMERPASSPHSS